MVENQHQYSETYSEYSDQRAATLPPAVVLLAEASKQNSSKCTRQ